MKTIKISHEYKCDNCDKPATINLQNNWQKFYITPKGNFKEIKSWDGDGNEFFCDPCYEK